MQRAFEQFEAKDKSVRQLFYKTAFVDGISADRIDRRRRRGSRSPGVESIATLHDHASFFVHLLSQIVDNINSEPTEIFKCIDSIGM